MSYIVEFSPFDEISQPETKLVSSSLIHLSDIQVNLKLEVEVLWNRRSESLMDFIKFLF